MVMNLMFMFLSVLIRGFIPHRFPVLFPKRPHGKSHWNINIISKVLLRRMFFSLIDLFIKKLPSIKISNYC